MPPGKRTHAVAAADWDPSSAEDRGAPAWHAPEQPLVIVRRNEPSSVNNKDAAKAQQTVLNATLTIDCTQDNAAVQGQLQEANDVLATCSGGPVALVLVYGDDKDSQEALARAAEDLGRAPHAGVKALSIKLAPSTLPTPPRLSADILARVMTALPSVQSLAITGYGRLDPTPETLQGLFKLEVYEMSESAGHHLTSIHLLEPQDAHGAFMMYPKLDILHLTKMVIAAPLNDELLACIVNHGPSITLLTVNDLALVFASGAHWAVEELCVTAPKQRTRLEIEQLMHLPKRAQHGRTTIKLPNRTLHFPAIRPDILLVRACCMLRESYAFVCMLRESYRACSAHHRFTSICSPESHALRLGTCVGTHAHMQGLSHDIRLRLNEWTIHVDKVTVPNTHELVTTALLRNVLQQLAPMQAPNAVVDLPGWDWDGNMLEVLANELRHLSFANINLIVPLTVAMLGYLYQYGMGINHLKLKSLCLVNDEYTSMPWPWPRVTVTNKRPTDVTQLLRLGNPSGRAPRPSLYLPGGLLFDHETISEVGVSLVHALHGGHSAWLAARAAWDMCVAAGMGACIPCSTIIVHTQPCMCAHFACALAAWLLCMYGSIHVMALCEPLLLHCR